MEVSARPRVTGWQGQYVPQLKYRNPVPPDEELEPQSSHTSTETAQRQPGPSIRDIRLSMSQQGQNKSPTRSLMAPSVENFFRTPPKKKLSMFGSLFAVKEPTQVALNQVAAQLISQHGSTSAKKVPNVSMEKMPQHVPKVNAKWDGIPDAVKQRERREKDRARTATNESMRSSTNRSRSSEQSGRPSETRASQNSSHSYGDRTKSQHSNSRKHDSFAPNPHRFYAQSVNSSGDLAAQQRPEEESRPSSVFSHPPSLQSVSSKSLADNGVFQDDIPLPPKLPPSHKRGESQAKNAHKGVRGAPPVDAVPEQKRSPVTTPQERSPVTPTQPAHEFGSMLQARLPSRNLKSENEPRPMAKVPLRPNPAFLAGEAQEFVVPDDDDDDRSLRSHEAVRKSSAAHITDLEKRPDSSRDRLGLRASMTVKGDKPWDPKAEYPYERPQSADDRTNAQLKPKSTISKAFGSLLKREM